MDENQAKELFVFRFNQNCQNEKQVYAGAVIDSSKNSFIKKSNVFRSHSNSIHSNGQKKENSASFSFNDNSLNFSNQNFENNIKTLLMKNKLKNQIVLEVYSLLKFC